MDRSVVTCSNNLKDKVIEEVVNVCFASSLLTSSNSMDLNKYLPILSKINQINSQDLEQYFATSTAIIENEIPTLKSLISTENISSTWNMYHILLDVKRLLMDKSEQKMEFDVLATSIQICAKYGLEPYLHPTMAKNKCFSNIYLSDVHSDYEKCYERLNSGIDTFCELLLIKELNNSTLFDEVLLTFLAAIFSDVRNDSESIHHRLDLIYEVFGERYFKVLLILKSNQLLPIPLQKMLHIHLMKRLVCRNGFEVLCKTLIKTGDDDNEPIWKKSATVFDIVGRKGHKKDFYLAIIDGIHQFLKKCIKMKEDEVFVETCVGSFSKIYNLGSKEVSGKIEFLLFERLEGLCSPKEIFAGYIVMENDEFNEMISTNFASFCSSVHVALPSGILVPYLPVLFQIFNQTTLTNLRNKISALIVQCLHNRERAELKSLINSLLFEDEYNHLKYMHPRMAVQFDNTNQEHKCVISKASDLNFFDASECLITILKSSNNNILTYNVFIHLFEQLDGSLNVSSQSQSDLIQTEDELTHMMSQIFKKRVAVYYTLSELINHKQLHYQFNVNVSEMLNICMNIIRNQTNLKNNTNNDEHTTILVLSVIKELLEKIQFTEQFGEFIKILVELKAKSKQNEIVDQIDAVLVALNHSEPKPFRICDKSQYTLAKELCEESEPHLKIYGLMQFIKLIRTEKDTETLNNKHAVLAISLICLKEDDSYVFLNCIKLLIVLVDVLESVVLEMLISEYQSTMNEVDLRLKYGEVIVKVVEGLGPISYKYKTILINCFLRECTSSINEIRLSSLSNLSSICRILSYQIHNFFQEMMIIIQSVIQNDNYLPARRSAVMVLTDIISGIENLIDFQEILLPVYKTLRDIVTNESDRSMRIHAQSGLEHLNSKIKDFLIPKQDPHKEIKIFGIKEEKNDKTKKCRFVDLNINK